MQKLCPSLLAELRSSPLRRTISNDLANRRPLWLQIERSHHHLRLVFLLERQKINSLSRVKNSPSNRKRCSGRSCSATPMLFGSKMNTTVDKSDADHPGCGEFGDESDEPQMAARINVKFAETPAQPLRRGCRKAAALERCLSPQGPQSLLVLARGLLISRF